MFDRLRILIFGFGGAAMLAACTGGTVSLTPPGIAVRPASLKFTVPEAQTITITERHETTVVATSGNLSIASVSPSSIRIDSMVQGTGTATFTVWLHSAGTAVINFRDAEGASANASAYASGAEKIYVNNGYTLKTYDATGAPTSPTITDQNGSGGSTVAGNGDIYFGNFFNSTVTTYDAAGIQIGPTLTAADGVSSPADVVTTNGNIYVANNNPGSVTTYDRNGMRRSPTINISSPGTLAVDAVGKEYVINGDNTMYSFDSRGIRTAPTIATPTSGMFPVGPSDIAVDAAGKIYIAIGGGIVKTYLPNGAPTTPTIRTGPGATPVDSLLTPTTAVRVDSLGKIFVAYSGTLFTYKPDGTRTTPTIAIPQPFSNPDNEATIGIR